MATRRSTRKIKAPPLASAPTAMSVLLATAPTAKRRRQDTSALDEKQPRSAKSVVEPQRGKGSSQHRAAACTAAHCTYVVMLSVPDDFVLPQVACSYGYYLVPPNVWAPDKTASIASGTFSRPLRFGERLKYTARCVISQTPSKSKGGAALKIDVVVERKLTKSDQDTIRSQVVRMFQTTADMTAWYKLNEEANERRFGRLFRSPTLFEDMVKSITACNMKFGGTIRMNKLLCEEFGRNGAFPTPEDLEGVHEEDLKERAKVGYRGDRILRLAQGFRDGSIDPAWLESPERTRDEVLRFVKKLHGFGDFAASNVAMHLKFYDIVPMDSETVRHFKDYHSIATKNVREVAPKVQRQYGPYAPYQFLQYWWEMIRWHEVKRGMDVHMWEAKDFANLS